MTCKLKFGDKDALRLIELGNKLESLKELIEIEPEDEEQEYTFECPYCRSDEVFSIADWNSSRDDNEVFECDNCHKRSATPWLFHELRELKRKLL